MRGVKIKNDDFKRIQDSLIFWYQINKRNLPWRQTNDAYCIWLSEIILQQTRVNQGLPYYVAFVETFPTLSHFANASLNQILKLWQGLGYYSRARNMHEAAKQLIHNGGVFPADYNALLKIKGIGSYTAAAIASFAFNLPHAVVDGNVYRVLSRYFGIGTPINSAVGKKQFAELAQRMLPGQNSATYNQAIMELGALICKPEQANCKHCPLQLGCYANATKQLNLLPVKTAAKPVKKRYMYFVLFHDNERLYLKQRTDKDIWQNLYVLPYIETATQQPIDKILESKFLKEFMEQHDVTVTVHEKTITHKLTHQHLITQFVNCRVKKLPANNNYKLSNSRQLNNYAVPRLIEKYLTEQGWL